MMKKIIFAGIAAILFTAANTVFAAAYGAEAVKENTSYSTEQMLTFALQDEYKARTLYRLVNETMQAPRPFINTEQAEAFHIEQLEMLCARYDVAVPEDNSAEYVELPASYLEAEQAGREAEQENIRMYTVFLEQELPDDIRSVFSYLRNASENHLAAFSRNAPGFGRNQNVPMTGYNRSSWNYHHYNRQAPASARYSGHHNQYPGCRCW